MRYQFYQKDNKVICAARYLGKVTRGYAKCDPRDEFDFEKGKKIAEMRCKEKIAHKRLVKAKVDWATAQKVCYDANTKLVKAKEYLVDAEKKVAEMAKAKENVMREAGL